MTTSKPRRLPKLLDFMSAVWSLDHGLQAMSKRMQRELGLTGPQRLVLRIVGRFPAISAGELAEILHLHPSTLTGIMTRLVQQGLLVRKVDARDGRRALFTLTSAGRKLDTKRHATVESVAQKILGELSEAEIDTARRVLDRLSAALLGNGESAAD